MTTDSIARSRASPASRDPRRLLQRQGSSQYGAPSPLKSSKNSSSSITPTTPLSPAAKQKNEEVIGGDITVKVEPGEAPKLSRSTAKRVQARQVQLFADAEDCGKEASRSYSTIAECSYVNKYIGTTDHALECECMEEWDAIGGVNHACGQDSDCINRATKMECIGDCGCGNDCQNQRFQNRAYADVTVIKTDKKGYGLRTNKPLNAHDFVYEYIGEVIGEQVFRRRMTQYDEEGIKHFYFMSLNKGEFVDATKKGNLGRFCNHSCNPNCYVDKWVVGDKLRMGIFAERSISAGEELVFNYNVDRYGANPQPCYCGEPNCTGFIGGKTQTERSTKLSAVTIEALGIEDGDDWDLAVAKKGRTKKKTGEDDEEYVDRVQPKSLDEGAVNKVMATLMQCKEKWIAVKLLNRIQQNDDERVRNRVVRMHGYRILKTVLSNFMDDANVALQIFEVLHTLPRLTRNKVQDSKIEETVEKASTHEDQRVVAQAESILRIWSSLEVGYRIPRAKVDPRLAKDELEGRRQLARQRPRSRSRSKSPSPPKAPSAPSGPRAGSGRPGNPGGSRPARRPAPPPSLPKGWHQARATDGSVYYYDDQRTTTTWTRPTQPAVKPPPPPQSLAKTNEQKLQDIIDGLTKDQEPTSGKKSGSGTPVTEYARSKSEKKDKEAKWRTLPIDKQKRIYEQSIHPHVSEISSRYKGKIEREALKRFSKEAAKKIVRSDYEAGRVSDPSRLSDKQVKNIRKYLNEWFKKAYEKQEAHLKKRSSDSTRDPGAAEPGNVESNTPPMEPPASIVDHSKHLAQQDVEMSDNDGEDDDSAGISSSSDRKRKREADETPLTGVSPEENESVGRKKQRSITPPRSPRALSPAILPVLRHKRDDEDHITAAVEGEEEGDYEPPPPPPPSGPKPKTVPSFEDEEYEPPPLSANSYGNRQHSDDGVEHIERWTEVASGA